MFGIGSGEIIILALVLIVVVGPKSMPKFIKAFGRATREFRAASQELRKQSGIDELLREDALGVRKLAYDIQKPPTPKRPTRLSAADRDREVPLEGADVTYARAQLAKRVEERQARETAEREAAEHAAARDPETSDDEIGPAQAEPRKGPPTDGDETDSGPEVQQDAHVTPISREDGEVPA